MTTRRPNRTPLRAREQIETERLRLERITREHQAWFVTCYGDPRVMQYVPPDGNPVSAKEAKMRFARILTIWDTHGFGPYIVKWRDTDSPILGYAGLQATEQVQGVELAYFLDPECWGQGIATEAAKACVAEAVNRLEAKQLVAISNPKNRPSTHILTVKLGFEHIPERDGEYRGMYSHFFTLTDVERYRREPNR